MDGQDRLGAFGCVPGEEDDKSCVEFLVEVIEVDKAVCRLVEYQLMLFERVGASRPWHGKEFVQALPDGGPGRIDAGMNEGDLQAASPRGRADMVNPISLYTYYSYYG